jgi:hypothetical protein
MYAMYKPLAAFVYIGSVLFMAGTIPILRFLYFSLVRNQGGHVQSLVLGGVLVILGCVTLLIARVADLINFNRQLIEVALEKVRTLEMQQRRLALPSVAVDSRPARAQSHASGSADPLRRAGL